MTIINKVSNKTLMPGITAIPDVPDAPTIGAVTDLGTGTSVSVAYTAAVTGGTVTTFTATSTPGSITATGSSPITVSGLTSGTAYTFKVKGTNATATGPESAASSSITPITPSSYVSLATATVTSNSTNTITFNDIPTTGYKHLELVVVARTTSSGTSMDEIQLRVGNGSIDTGLNYSYAFMYASGNTTARSNTGTGQGYLRMGFASRNANPSNQFAANLIQIADYANTSKIKVIQCQGGASHNTTDGISSFCTGLWNSTSAINYIELKTELNWVAGSTATLYGIKDS